MEWLEFIRWRGAGGFVFYCEVLEALKVLEVLGLFDGVEFLEGEVGGFCLLDWWWCGSSAEVVRFGGLT